MGHSSSQPVILATGLQSSGSTLISWCFLQRADCDGVLDGDTDLIPLLPDAVTEPHVWYKTTISCFTLEDLAACLQDDGHMVRPLLIVRDVRSVWSSLMHKHYGRNGITAEDPPLRTRFRRFLRSWEYAVAENIPVLKFEQFTRQPEQVLRTCCAELSLPWDDGMLNWPKPLADIANTRHGNATFRQSDKQGLLAALSAPAKGGISGAIHQADLDWLDASFAEFNKVLGYPARLDGVETLPGRLLPDWEVSRRRKWRLKQKPVRYLLSKLGLTSYTPRPE